MQPGINLPVSLRAILETNKELHGVVAAWLSTFETVLQHSRLPFFPDFTDHGLDHISEVLSTVATLIPDVTLRLLTAGDVAVLTLGVLLHDIGMHLTRDGFVALVEDKSGLAPVQGLDERSWSAQWGLYLGEASRFSGRQNITIYGTPEPVIAPDLAAQDWTEKQFYMIGEFLRRQHASLAHQIALGGFPGARLTALPPSPPHIVRLAGLVARSHGIPLRKAMDYLEETYGDKLAPYQIHVVYLMALLRIADYLQIHPSRAPLLRPRLQHLRSPVSKREWAKHAAVQYVSFDHVDTDALYAYVEPPDVETYLAVTALIADIQAEIDSTWAILGECYSRHTQLCSLLLSKRRIRTNLEKPLNRRRFPYVPARAAFGAAESDLLKLVIGPLYENKPEIGIRELLQNSVDAVREVYAYRENRRISHPTTPGTPDVSARLLAGPEGFAVEIADQGIGMTEDVIQHYFLRAAASFRYSDAWRREFQDRAGGSTVLRSGRFGIGVLAAFLMGNEISVSTRHIAAETGIEFFATLETDPIELKYVDRQVGTTIRVAISEEVYRRLRDRNGANWDWYCLAFPGVVRESRQEEAVVATFPNVYNLPDLGVMPHGDWRVVEIDKGFSVGWSFTEGPAVVSNGLLVQRNPPFHMLTGQNDHGVAISCPNLSIFDKNGKLPLNLQRTALSESAAALLHPVAEDIALDFLACAATTLPDRILHDDPSTRKTAEASSRPRVRFHRPDELEYSPWAHTKRGAVLLAPALLRAAGISRVLLVRQPRRFGDSLSGELYGIEDMIVPEFVWTDLPDGAAVVGLHVPQGVSPYLSHAFGTRKEPMEGSPLGGLGVKGARICSARHHSFYDVAYPPVTSKLDQGWLETFGDCPAPDLDYVRIMSAYTAQGGNLAGTMFADLFLGDAVPTGESVIETVYKRCFDRAVLPFDVARRSECFEKAPAKFHQYRALWAARPAIARRRAGNCQPESLYFG